MKVEFLMTSDVETCSTEDDANRAAQIMWENDCGFVVVLTPGKRVAGTITDRDLCMAAYTHGLALGSIAISEIMSTEVVSCLPDDDVLKVAPRLRAFQVRRLPVIDADGALVGIITLNDLARRAAVERGSSRRSLTLEAVAETLAEVGRPRTKLGEVAPSFASFSQRRNYLFRTLQLARGLPVASLA
jgi:CBS-domain-containing membrane protein